MNGHWPNWVIDATVTRDAPPFAFCPVDDDGTIVTGIMVIRDTPPGHLVGVIHEDGQQAVEDWCEQHSEALAALG